MLNAGDGADDVLVAEQAAVCSSGGLASGDVNGERARGRQGDLRGGGEGEVILGGAPSSSAYSDCANAARMRASATDM